jgi:hypothetical protein
MDGTEVLCRYGQVGENARRNRLSSRLATQRARRTAEKKGNRSRRPLKPRMKHEFRGSNA